MFLHVQHDVQISRRPPELSDLARARKADSRPVLNSRGNFRVDRALPEYAPLASTLRARIGNHAARPLARGTSAGNAEKSLLISHLPTSRAGTAIRRPLTWRRTGPVAVFTSL